MTFAVPGLLFLLCAVSSPAEEPDFQPLFNGKNLEGWTNVNCAESTWSFNDEGMLVCTGKPIGEIRTTKMYQNFILELEWRHLKPRGNAGVFVWADDITARGQPFIRGVEIQVLENAYGQGKGHTTHGDIFPIHGAKMTPINGRTGMRAFPTEDRSKPSPEWNHYRIECRDGSISLAVNGKIVTRGVNASPRKGYLCLESEGGVVNYRNVRIAELPDTPVEPADTAIADRGYRCLYTGVDLSGWKSAPGWSSRDWTIRHEGGKEPTSIETEEHFGNIGFVIDFAPGKDFKQAKIQIGAMEFTIDPSTPNDARLFEKPGQWHRFEGEISGDTCSVILNGKPFPHQTVSNSGDAPLKITTLGSAEWANIYVRELKGKN